LYPFTSKFPPYISVGLFNSFVTCFSLLTFAVVYLFCARFPALWCGAALSISPPSTSSLSTPYPFSCRFTCPPVPVRAIFFFTPLTSVLLLAGYLYSDTSYSFPPPPFPYYFPSHLISVSTHLLLLCWTNSCRFSPVSPTRHPFLPQYDLKCVVTCTPSATFFHLTPRKFFW